MSTNVSEKLLQCKLTKCTSFATITIIL